MQKEQFTKNECKKLRNMSCEMLKQSPWLVKPSRGNRWTQHEIGAKILIKKIEIDYDDQIEKHFLTGSIGERALQDAKKRSSRFVKPFRRNFSNRYKNIYRYINKVFSIQNFSILSHVFMYLSNFSDFGIYLVFGIFKYFCK